MKDRFITLVLLFQTTLVQMIDWFWSKNHLRIRFALHKNRILFLAVRKIKKNKTASFYSFLVYFRKKEDRYRLYFSNELYTLPLGSLQENCFLSCEKTFRKDKNTKGYGKTVFLKRPSLYP